MKTLIYIGNNGCFNGCCFYNNRLFTINFFCFETINKLFRNYNKRLLNMDTRFDNFVYCFFCCTDEYGKDAKSFSGLSDESFNFQIQSLKEIDLLARSPLSSKSLAT